MKNRDFRSYEFLFASTFYANVDRMIESRNRTKVENDIKQKK